MSLDQYSLCPCGNGKKIKFCKCVDSFSEMVKVQRMIDGDQSVAALDRINQLIKQLPSESWLLAMKCELQLKLKEIDGLEETSAKFIRLRPDNPLAQLYRSLVAIIRGNLEEASSLYLEAFGSSAETLNVMFVNVSINLIDRLASEQKHLSAFIHAELLAAITPKNPEFGRSALEKLSSARGVSLLQRCPLPIEDKSAGEPWAERFQEALAAISSMQYGQAKTKLESLQREFGDESTFLSLLVTCRLALADVEGAARLCERLAVNEKLSVNSRIFWQAMAFELAPSASGLMFKDMICVVDASQWSAIEETLLASGIRQNPEPQLARLITAILEEEVPPKAVYTMVEDLPNQYDGVQPKASTGWVAYFGRQTDKNPRLVYMESTAEVLGSNQARLEKALDTKFENVEVVKELDVVYHAYFSNDVIADQPIQDANEQERLMADIEQRTMDRFLNLALPMLDNKTPAEACNDAAYEVKLSALLFHSEASNSMQLNADDFAELAEKLNLSRPSVDLNDENRDAIGAANYLWADLEKIDSNSFFEFAQAALSLGMQSLYSRVIEKGESLEFSGEEADYSQYMICNLKLRSAEDPESVDSALEKLIEVAPKVGAPVGEFVLMRFESLNRQGRTSEASVLLQKAVQENPQDPHLQQFMQMAMARMQQMQGGAAGGQDVDLSGSLMKHQKEKSTVQTLSDVSQSQNVPSEGGSGGGSKLWLPGQ